MKVGCAQLAYRGRDLEPGLARVRANVEHLAGWWPAQRSGGEIDLLVLGELWLSSPTGPEGYRTSAVTPADLGACGLGELARQKGAFVLANVVEVVEGALFDSSVLFDHSGELRFVYRELAGGMIAESPIVGPIGTAVAAEGPPAGAGLGRYLPVVDTELGRLSTVVGSDLAFPELASALALAGVDILLHPCKESPAAAGAWQALKPARAIEAGMAIVSCNIADSAAGPEDRWASAWGGSRVVAPSGEVLAAASGSGEELVVAELDLAEIRRASTGPRPRRRRSAPWLAQCAELFATAAATAHAGGTSQARSGSPSSSSC